MSRWKNWLQLHDQLYVVDELATSVLPAAVIGEIFVFLYNQWAEGVIRTPLQTGVTSNGTPDEHDNASYQTGLGSDVRSSYVYAFWYALVTQELAWVLGSSTMMRPGGRYTCVVAQHVKDVLKAAKDRFDRAPADAKSSSTPTQRDLVLAHSLVWLHCPLFSLEYQSVKEATCALLESYRKVLPDLAALIGSCANAE